MASIGQDGDGERKKREDEKRKREEDGPRASKKIKKTGGAVNTGLADEEPIPGSSLCPAPPNPYTRTPISRFRIHQVLGRGNFGKVVLARVPGRKIYTAVKMVNKNGDNQDAIKRERQILIAARDCPFICHLYATHQSQQRAYFIMEYLPGGSLEALLKLCGNLSINNVRFYTAEIVCGLQFLHGHNIVHRDLKPENIMFDADGHIRIIDLGLAQDGVTTTNLMYDVTGTFNYMAPEVHFRKGYGAAADWWSLGIVVTRMAAGCYPFYIGPIQQKAFLAKTMKEPKFPDWLDARVKHLIQQLLQKYPEKRLGVCGNIREHPFFSTIGWEELEERRAVPPCAPFPPVLRKEHLQWPEDTDALLPEAEFNCKSPSWARWMRRSGL